MSDPSGEPHPPAAPVVYTVGHGNRSLEEFLALLRHHGIRCLVDIRAYPGSRRYPHFAREALAAALDAEGIRYVWEGQDLGGFRHGTENHHTAIESPGFRAYCAHMESERFRLAAERVLALARESVTAVMCAERLYWHCHRFFLADYLLLLGARVVHLISEKETREHHMNPLARAEGDRLIYDGGQGRLV
jgi:uncharacterized protein (DUF488 family)